MSLNPFLADPEIRLRHERLAQSIGIRLHAEIVERLSASVRQPGRNDSAVLPKQQAEALVARYSLTTIGIA